MLLLDKNTENIIIVTCNEAVTVTDPYYQIIFTNEQTGEQETLDITDESQYPERYNAFTVNVSETYVTSGSVDLDYGFYRYEIKFGSISDPAFAMTRCEIGRAYVRRPEDSTTNADPVKEYIVYKK